MSETAEQTVKDAQIARDGNRGIGRPSGIEESRRRISRRIGKDQYEEYCVVYFIEAVGMGLVKIGYTLRPVERFMGMLGVCPCPLSLLGSMQGGPRKERQLHNQLAEYRTHGEWFKKVPEVEAVIATCTHTYGLELMNQVAKYRGEALQAYLAKLKAGEVTRPTKGKHKRPRSLNPGSEPYAPSTIRSEER
jgi:hypothetical protein